MDRDVDLLIIGAGACGLAAAISGADMGMSVAVIEKTHQPGGNSALSTGSVPGSGTRFQREAGIEDSPEKHFADLMDIAGDGENHDLMQRMAEVSAQIVEWLIDDVGAKMQLITAYKHIGHSVPRLHAPASRRGADLVADLLSATEARGVPVAVGNSAQQLIVENSDVVGAVIDSGDTKPFEVRAGGVLLALNGFAANRDLVARYVSEISGAAYFGALGSEGEAIRWGQELGADLVNMGSYQGYAAVADPHGSILSWTTIEKGGVLLGADARRFGDESLGYSGFAHVVLEQGQNAWAVFDQRIFEIAAQEEEFLELFNHGGLHKGETVAEAVAAYGLDGVVAEDVISAYNNAASGALPDPFGRRDFGGAPLIGPYYVCKVQPALFHTQGGLRVDGNGRVLRNDGAPIKGLYAGGGAAAGISGGIGALGYASGNGLLTAIALGRLSALAAAQDLGLTG
jgi:fumarate reductase flavoprotein subunit